MPFDRGLQQGENTLGNIRVCKYPQISMSVKRRTRVLITLCVKTHPEVTHVLAKVTTFNTENLANVCDLWCGSVL